MPDEGFRFHGFRSPTYTQVPDELFDQLLPHLKEAELKALLYIVRRTFGFKREADAISFNQFLRGVVTRDGRQLDGGCGVKNRTNLSNALKSLEEKGIIVAAKSWDERGENQTTIYKLRFAGVVPEEDYPSTASERQVVPHQDYPSAAAALPVVPQRYPQETVVQETVVQETVDSNSSNGHELVMSKSDAERLAWVVRDISREFADQAPLKSSATRACHLYAAASVDLETFLDLVQAARLRTKRYTGSIKASPIETGKGQAIKPKMAYFFGVLEQLTAPENRSSRSSNPE